MNRIVHVVPALFDPDHGVMGGAERYAFELARHMAEVVPTTLVAFGPDDHRERQGPLEVRVLGHPHLVRGQPQNPFRWAALQAVRGADVVHCHQQHLLVSSVIAAYRRLTGAPVFVSDLGGGGWDISAYVSTDNWYDGHLHISEYSRRVYGHGRRPDAHVILGGVDTRRFAPDPGVVREKTILFVGRLLPHKGVHDIIAALPEGLSLEVIGRPYDARYAADLQAQASGKAVTFRHDCDDDALVAAYRRALCVVLPSVYRDPYGGETRVPELLGQTLLEGMACGTPAVCTDVASMPEVVRDGVTGFVVPPGDPAALRAAFARLRDAPELAPTLGAGGRAWVLARFTWQKVVERCLAIYRGERPVT